MRASPDPGHARADAQAVARACADAMYAHDVASQGLAMRIEAIAPGRAVLSMTITERMVNGQGIAHGGFIFALADSSFAFACNTYDEFTVAQGAEIDFIRPVQCGETLLATATEVSRGRRNGLYEVRVCREDGTLVAWFRGKSCGLGKPILTATDPEIPSHA
jgi:acyl-CoA thioesterase